MTICKGIVQDNVVFLEAGIQLPEGAEGEVRLRGRRMVDPNHPGLQPIGHGSGPLHITGEHGCAEAAG